MGPLYTMLVCIPAGLAFITAVCGLAGLWSPPAGAPPPLAASGRSDGGGGRAGHLLDSRDGLLSEISMHVGFAYSEKSCISVVMRDF